jgi:3-phenylpropionate/trans-cinnamate dioxygenase ferredoxin reductase subunit
LTDLLVIGASLAGLRAAQAARGAGFEGSLTIVGEEPVAPYDRPPLSKHLLWGEYEPDDCALASEELEATWRLGEAATALDLGERSVRLASGEALGFDRLVIATGSRARRWPGSGGELPGVLTLRNLDDATALREELGRQRRIAIVGAGFVGCEVAASARRAGLAVTLIDVAERPMAALGELLGDHCAALHREHGVELRLGVGVEEIVGEERVRGVRLADGTTVESELVLVALGGEPYTAWLEGSGLQVEAGGVRCDHQLAALGATDVWCAGDVCTWPHPLSAQPAIRIEHWTNAAEQGSLAGRNAAVEPRDRAPFGSLPSFWSDQFDSRFQAVGFPREATATRLVERSEAGDRLVAIGERDGTVVSALAVNGARRLPWYRRMIIERAGVDAVLAALAKDTKTLGPVGEPALG